MRYLLIAALALGAGTAAAQEPRSEDVSHVIVLPPGEILWSDAPAVLPPGAKAAVLEGDPAAAGPFTLRLSMPDGYRIPPHYHPAVEHVTVMEGTLKVGMGERFDASAMTQLPTGTFAAIQPGMRHFAEAQGETVIQLHGIGPWNLVYVNPADDPRRRTP